MIEISKSTLFERVEQLLLEKLDQSKFYFNQLQESLHGETKSTAGDKHETGRAMVQFEIEQAGKLINEHEIQLNSFKKIPLLEQNSIHLGSLVQTNNGLFFISVSLGKVEIDNRTVLAIGPNAPLSKLFIGKQINDTITFNKQNYLIENIY